MPLQSAFPEALVGETVVLRRHRPENLDAFRRWYGDPEIARLTRYRDGPMRPDEIERFFTARVLGIDSLTLAIHVKATDQLIGSCAFSQLDGDNGSALYHITIGEKGLWGHGYGTEVTELMLTHAFTGMGLHRVSLAVFSFNERAIRSYEKTGFVVDGRAREAIFRDGRYWDEITMSMLESEWRAIRARTVGDSAGSVSPSAAANGAASGVQASGVQASGATAASSSGARAASSSGGR